METPVGRCERFTLPQLPPTKQNKTKAGIRDACLGLFPPRLLFETISNWIYNMRHLENLDWNVECGLAQQNLATVRIMDSKLPLEGRFAASDSPKQEVPYFK